MAEKVIDGAASGALTVAVVSAGMPLAIGFAVAGALGASVGFLRNTLEQEKAGKQWSSLPFGCHLFHFFRGLVLAEFVCMVIFLTWLEMGWPWAWGLIAACVSSVFAPEAIEVMWSRIKTFLDAWKPKI